MNADDIRRQAEQERQKEARKNRRRNKRRSGPRPFTPQGPESWHVFTRIYPHDPNRLLWVALPLVLAVSGWVMLMINWKRHVWLLPYTLAVTALPVAVYLLTYIRKRLQYPAYKTWRRGLGFPVNGWDRLGASENFPRTEYWDDLLTVEIQLKNTASTETIKLAEDILYLFTIAANKGFYSAEQAQAGLAGDIRNKWKKTGTLTVAGSADGYVMGQLYLGIDKNLRAVQQQTGVVQAVSLSFSKRVYRITPEQTSSG